MSKEEGLQYKKEDFSNWYSDVLAKAKILDLRYKVKGTWVLLPYGERIKRNITKLFEKFLEEDGHEPVSFPVFIPEHFLEKEKEHVSFKKEVFWVTEAGESNKKFKERLALRPTSETAFYTLYSLWIQSYKDLPFKRYQTCKVWRYESKATRPLLRGWEFFWIETHDAFKSEEEAKNQIKRDFEMFKEVLQEKLKVPFLFLRRPQHDKFAGAEETYAVDIILENGKVLQIGTSHYLGRKFSIPFDVKFLDKDKKWKHVYQTCCGPGISRIVAAVISIHGDDKGLKLPFEIAPIQIVIIPIKNEERILKKAKEIKEILKEYRVKIDDSNKGVGWKHNHYELLGVPIRIEIGMKEVEKNFVTIARRDTFEKVKVKVESLKDEIKKIVKSYEENLYKEALRKFEEKIVEVSSYDELKDALSKGKVAKANWCGSIDCANKIKEELGGEVRGNRIDIDERRKGKCVVCGKECEEVYYVAKAY